MVAGSKMILARTSFDIILASPTKLARIPTGVVQAKDAWNIVQRPNEIRIQLYGLSLILLTINFCR